MRLIPIIALFLLGPAGAWAWFHLGTRPPEVAYEFAVRPAVPGFTFTAVPVGEKEMDVLATTNLVNGEFSDGTRRFTVFAADWKAETAKQMAVVQHTPDVCWVGAGFRPVTGRAPTATPFTLDGVEIPFQLRVFEMPGASRQELTVWCTLVGGQILEEGFRFSGPVDSGDRSDDEALRLAKRVLQANQFFRNVQARTASDGSKQFVRISTQVDHGPVDESLDALRRFAAEWVGLRRIGP